MLMDCLLCHDVVVMDHRRILPGVAVIWRRDCSLDWSGDPFIALLLKKSCSSRCVLIRRYAVDARDE